MVHHHSKFTILSIMFCAVALLTISCEKDETTGPEEPIVSKISYRSRVLEVTVGNGTTRIDVPFTVIAKEAVYAGKGVVGTVDYDRTTAVKELHYAFPDTEPAGRIDDTTYTFPILFFSERITEPLTLTLCGDFPHFGPQALPFIDTLTIRIRPTAAAGSGE